MKNRRLLPRKQRPWPPAVAVQAAPTPSSRWPGTAGAPPPAALQAACGQPAGRAHSDGAVHGGVPWPAADCGGVPSQRLDGARQAEKLPRPEPRSGGVAAWHSPHSTALAQMHWPWATRSTEAHPRPLPRLLCACSAAQAPAPAACTPALPTAPPWRAPCRRVSQSCWSAVMRAPCRCA